MVSTLTFVLAAGFGQNDDRDVIQSMLLSFFKREDWHSADWKPIRHVVLGTKASGKERQSFQVALNQLRADTVTSITSCKDYVNSANKEQAREARRQLAEYRKTLKSLDGVRRSVGKSGTYSPPPIRPFSSMPWDPRIIVTDKSNRYFTPEVSADTKLERSTVYAYADLPSYSNDGRYAIERFRIPWSIHSAEVWFVLERKNGNWVRVAHRAVFYV